MDQKERLAALTNKDDHKDKYNFFFEELVKKGFHEMKESTDEINKNDLKYDLEENTARKRFVDFNNGIELF